MNNLRRLHTAIWLAPCLLALYEAPAADRKPDDSEKNAISAPGTVWREPADIASRNLLYGSGGEKHQPRGPFTFVKEDLDGSNPKFTIVDSQAVKWKVKMGQEARCETAASRLVWAAGYFTTDDYYLPELQVPDMPRL